MTATEFKARQSALGLTNEDSATILRVSVRTVEKWRQGSRSVPGPVTVISALLTKYKGAIQYLLDRASSYNQP